MSKPLKGKTVVVTRAVEQADELVSQLIQLGAKVVHIPTLEIVPPDSWQECDAAIEKLEQYHWLIFTSTNGVKFFTKRLKEFGKSVKYLKTKQIAAVGERTGAELQDLGLQVDVVPEEFRAEGLLRSFEKINMQGRFVLLLKAQQASDVLLKNLTSMGAKVDAVAVYKNQPVSRDNFYTFQSKLNGQLVDVLTFTSPSTVQNFVSIFGEKQLKDWITNGCRIAAIGGVTANALGEYRFRVDIFPQKSTIPSLVEAIEEFYA